MVIAYVLLLPVRINSQPKICQQSLSRRPCHPLVTNGFSNPYNFDESTFILRGIRSNVSFLFHFSMKIILVDRKALDGTPRFAASHLGLFCKPLSHKKDARLVWVNQTVSWQTF